MNARTIRRTTVALFALALAAPLLRAPMSFAVVARGDDFLYRGKTERAVEYYERAVAIDEANDVAVDRFAFFSLQGGTGEDCRRSLRVAARFLRAHESADVRADRALCELRLRRYREAAGDFAVAGRALHDARYLTFAGWASLRGGRRAVARSFWREAGALGFAPAKAALERLQ